MRESYHETWSAVDHTYIIRSLIWNWHLGIWLRDERKLSWDVIGSRSHIIIRSLIWNWHLGIWLRDERKLSWDVIGSRSHIIRSLIWNWHLGIWLRDERKLICHETWSAVDHTLHYQIFDLELAPRYLVERWEKVIMRRDRQSITHYQIFDLELAPRYLVERWEKVIMRRDWQSITHYQIFDLELAPRYLVQTCDRPSIRSLIWYWICILHIKCFTICHVLGSDLWSAVDQIFDLILNLHFSYQMLPYMPCTWFNMWSAVDQIFDLILNLHFSYQMLPYMPCTLFQHVIGRRSDLWSVLGWDMTQLGFILLTIVVLNATQYAM